MTPSQRTALIELRRTIRQDNARKNRLAKTAMPFDQLEEQLDGWLTEEGYIDLTPVEKVEAHVAKTKLGRVLRFLPFCMATDLPASAEEAKKKAEAKES